MKTLHAHVPVSQRADRRAWTIYGRAFEHDGTPKSKESARQAAEAFGLERQAAMVAQNGGKPLTSREELTGNHAPPPAPDLGPQPCGQRRSAEANPNHYTGRCEELEKQLRAAPLASDRAKINKRLELFRAKEAEFAIAQANAAATSSHQLDPDVVRLREHAARKLDEARLDPTLTPEQVEKRSALKALADSETTAGTYWTAVRDTFGEAPPAKPANVGPKNLYEAQDAG